MAARRVIVGSLVLHFLATYDHAYPAAPPVHVIERALALYLAGCMRRFGYAFGYCCRAHDYGGLRHFRRLEREQDVGDTELSRRCSATRPVWAGRECRFELTDADPGGRSLLGVAQH